MAPRPSLLASLLFVAAACGGSDTSIEPAEVHAEVSAGAEETVAHPYGDTALLTVMVQPERWDDVHQVIVSLLGEEPPDGDLRRLVAFRSFADLLTLESRRWGAMARDLPAFDGSRPVVLRMWELPAAAQTLQSAFATVDDAPSPLRHVIVVPSTDPATTAAGLRERAAERCEEVSPDTLRCFRGALHLVPDEDQIFVVLDQSETSPALDSLYGRAAPTRSFRWATDRQHPVAAHVRGSALRHAFVQQGAMMVSGALAAVSDDFRGVMRSVGVGELLGAYARSGPEGREIAEAAVALRSTPQPAIVWAAELTPTGVERFAQAPSAGAGSGGGDWFDLRSRLALGEVGLPAGYEGLSDSRRREAFTECGFACVLQSLAQPLAAYGLMRETGLLPREPAFVPRPDPALPAGGLALDVDLRRAPDASIQFLGRFVSSVHARSELRGDSWLGTLSARQPDSDFLPLPSGPAALAGPDEPACVRALALRIGDALQAVANTSEAERRTIIGRTREQVATIACDHPSAEHVRAALRFLPEPGAP